MAGGRKGIRRFSPLVISQSGIRSDPDWIGVTVAKVPPQPLPASALSIIPQRKGREGSSPAAQRTAQERTGNGFAVADQSFIFIFTRAPLTREGLPT